MQFDEIYFPEILVRKLHGPVPRNPFPRESLGKKIAPNSFNKKYKLAPPERKLPMEIKISAATSCTNTHTHTMTRDSRTARLARKVGRVRHTRTNYNRSAELFSTSSMHMHFWFLRLLKLWCI